MLKNVIITTATVLGGRSRVGSGGGALAGERDIESAKRDLRNTAGLSYDHLACGENEKDIDLNVKHEKHCAR